MRVSMDDFIAFGLKGAVQTNADARFGCVQRGQIQQALMMR